MEIRNGIPYDDGAFTTKPPSTVKGVFRYTDRHGKQKIVELEDLSRLRLYRGAIRMLKKKGAVLIEIEHPPFGFDYLYKKTNV